MFPRAVFTENAAKREPITTAFSRDVGSVARIRQTRVLVSEPQVGDAIYEVAVRIVAEPFWDAQISARAVSQLVV
jgi:hypothetical protein